MKEILDPIVDFYKMHNRKEKIFYVLIPTFVGVISYTISILVHGKNGFFLPHFSQDFINQLITMLTLFVSFTMTYLSIIISSNSDNINDLKSTLSIKYWIKKKGDCSLYNILINQITYGLTIEIFFLLFVIFEKFVMHMVDYSYLKIILAIDLALFVHILIIMLLVIKDIYFSFWQSK